MEKHICPLCGEDKPSFLFQDFKGNKYWRCSSEGFVFQRPISSVNDNTLWTSAVDPDGRKRDLTKERDFKLKNWYGDIVNNLNHVSSAKVLDIGCGLGYLLSALPESWQKYGYEVSDFAKNFINSNFAEIKLIDDLYSREDEISDKYRDYFDVVICYHVIEHIEYPDVFMSNLRKIIKPKGILIIGTPNVGSIAAKLFKGNFRLLGDGHSSLFNQKILSCLMKKYGFKIYKKEFPFVKTDYFTLVNLLKMFNVKKISPAFYGSIMTFYARREGI